MNRIERLLVQATTLSTPTVFLMPAMAFAQAGITNSAPSELPPPSFTSSLLEMMPMFMIVFMIFYLMVLKPQQKKLQDQEKLIKGLKKGDQVVTSSGIIGRVAGTDKDHILLELSPNVRVKFQPTHIAKLLEPEQEKGKESSASKAVAS
jgi:preprotein translocase subunit YajC